MSNRSERLSRFWDELKRRKVIPILIAYLAASFAIIEFTDITSSKFSLPDSTFNLLYILAAIGLPLAIILPWYFNRKDKEATPGKSATEEDISEEDEQGKLHNLPVPLTNFIGREKEIPTVKQLIKEHRLVSLIGAGGCGKTRLAIEVASNLVQDYKDGVWFVDLAPLTSEDLVANEIAEVLNIQEVPNQPIVETLIEKIKEKKLLIILDNCEHLIKASAEITGKLVQEVQRLQLLVTSREALCIKGEQVWRVPSLTLIEPKTIINIEQAKESEAVMLFADRARLNNPEFELEPSNIHEVTSICNDLDGIPLALELVASRTRHMSAQMIMERFADRYDQLSSSDPAVSKRQQTLQATIEWSYNLLSVKEKLLFARLAVFNGGFDIKAAEEVCSDDQLPKDTILDALSRLVDRSLVHILKGADQLMRYSMLETIRQFALQMLKSSQEEDFIKKQHLIHFLSIAEVAYEEQFDSQFTWINNLTAEQDNFLAAISWSMNNSIQEYIKLVGYLSWFWIIKGQYNIVRDHQEKAVSQDTQDSEAYARVLYGLSTNLWYFGDLERAMDLLDKSLIIWRESRNFRDQATALSWLGYRNQVQLNNKQDGLKYSEQGLAMAREIGQPGLINHCMERFCSSLVHSKQFKAAIPYVDELLISSKKLNQPWGSMAAQHYHSDCALGTKDFKEAEKRYALGMKMGVDYGSDWMALIDMQGVAFALSGQSRWVKCLRINAAACGKASSIGLSTKGILEFWDEWIETYIEGAKAEVGEELTQKYEEEGIAMGFDMAVEYALDFDKD